MFYVYYEKENRTIISITNEKNDSLQDFVIKQKDEVIDFILGNKNTNDYVLDQELNLTPIEKYKNKFEFNQAFHKIEKITDADLVVSHGSNWQFKKISNITGNLFFAVTEKDNPNKLIRAMHFPATDLDCNFDFKYPIEQDADSVSIWIVHKTFAKCSLEIQ